MYSRHCGNSLPHSRHVEGHHGMSFECPGSADSKEYEQDYRIAEVASKLEATIRQTIAEKCIASPLTVNMTDRDVESAIKQALNRLSYDKWFDY